MQAPQSHPGYAQPVTQQPGHQPTYPSHPQQHVPQGYPAPPHQHTYPDQHQQQQHFQQHLYQQQPITHQPGVTLQPGAPPLMAQQGQPMNCMGDQTLDRLTFYSGVEIKREAKVKNMFSQQKSYVIRDLQGKQVVYIYSTLFFDRSGLTRQERREKLLPNRSVSVARSAGFFEDRHRENVVQRS